MAKRTVKRVSGRRCRRCGQPCRGRRRNWCSEACVQAWLDEHHWGRMLARVWERDQGVCRRCGLDCGRLQRIVRGVVALAGGQSRATAEWVLVALGFDRRHVAGRRLWEADHIRARKEGGLNALSNLRTLCAVCHKRRSARQVSDWARLRRSAAT